MANKNIHSLDGLIQTKGAPRPEGMSQRGEATVRDTSPTIVAAPAPRAEAAGQRSPAKRELRAKSLTLRLSEGQYERLRKFAFERRLSHQDIIETALMEYLTREEQGA